MHEMIRSVAMALCAAAGVLPLAAGELLYNGIELPAKWPPTRTAAEIRSYAPMRVPYLEQPPATIPIDIGRQLFVDDFLIDSTTLTRRFHQAQFHSGNPVLRPDQRWETRGPIKTAMAYSDGCFYDPRDQLFKMWYAHAQFSGMCYATSKDGLNWQKPPLDVMAQTNIVFLTGQRNCTTVWLDHETADPAQRFKLMAFHRDAWRVSLHVSADGIHWGPPTWCGPAGDRTTMYHNLFRKVWVYSLRAEANTGPANYRTKPYNQILRARKYWESSDFLEGAKWTSGPDMPPERLGGRFTTGGDWPEGSPQFWLGADRLDTPGAKPDDLKAELHNLDATPYESLMLGLFNMWRRPPSGQTPETTLAPNSIHLGFSRDGYHWDRPYREAVIAGSGDPKSWNQGDMQSVGGGCLIVGDRIFMYASGRNATEETTGVAFFRRDGFASMEAGENEGTLTTRPLKFSGKHLFVNFAAPQGELSAEILDREGKVIVTYSKASSLKVRGDQTRQRLQWKDGGDLSRLAGQPVRFRFYLKRGALYAFWVSREPNGASHGYVAAGGPGFSGATDTVGDGSGEFSSR